MAYSIEMKPPYDPPARTIRSAPIHCRRPSTSAAHCSCVKGGLPSLSPEPRASKTTTRKVSASAPKLARGSARDPSPGAPWCAISTGAPSGPRTSTASLFPLISTNIGTPDLQVNDRVLEVARVRGEGPWAVLGHEDAVGVAVSVVAGAVEAGLAGD